MLGVVAEEVFSQTPLGNRERVFFCGGTRGRDRRDLPWGLERRCDFEAFVFVHDWVAGRIWWYIRSYVIMILLGRCRVG